MVKSIAEANLLGFILSSLILLSLLTKGRLICKEKYLNLKLKTFLSSLMLLINKKCQYFISYYWLGWYKIQRFLWDSTSGGTIYKREMHDSLWVTCSPCISFSLQYTVYLEPVQWRYVVSLLLVAFRTRPWLFDKASGSVCINKLRYSYSA